MFVVGRFSRVIKSDGTLLFVTILSDADFLLDIRHLFHAELGTEFKLKSIVKVSKGYHVKIESVNNPHDAAFFENESFALPENEVDKTTVDYLIGMKMETIDGEYVGEIDSFSKTRDYYILSVKNEDASIMIPYKDEIIELSTDKVVLLREELLEI